MGAGLQAGTLLRRKRYRHVAIVASAPTAPTKPPTPQSYRIESCPH
jgi:hypothetical protein